MTFLYLDTSGLVKRYVAEAGSDEVIAAMARADAVVTSLVTRTEVSAAIAKAVRRRVLDDDGGRRAHRRFLDEWPDFWRMPVTDALVARADTLAWDHGLRAKCLWPFALATGYERRLVSNNTDGLNGAP